MKRIIIKSIALVVTLFCVAVTWFYLEMWIPYKTVSNSGQWNPDNGFQGEMPRKKIRDACHKILRYRFAVHYDAFYALEKVGNKDSIPYLIRALKWQNLEWQNCEFTPCSCCISSLEKLTGMEFEDDHEKWERWWKQTGRYLPFDEEKGQLILPENEK